MGVDTRRPPLPAPTDMSSMDDSSAVGTEVAPTEFTARTDKTHFTIPDDGRPITIATHKGTGSSSREGRHHSRQKSQTSLLIEYFEASKSDGKQKSKPSVRVRVTPSSRKSSRGNDAVQITGIGKDRKPSYTRRISLGSKTAEVAGAEGTEISHSSESNLSGRPPIEVEVVHHDGSDMSNAHSSRGLLYATNDSNISSLPPDSLLEGRSYNDSELSRGTDLDEDRTVTENEHLSAPIHTRDRSVSHERLTQKVMEKLGQSSGKTRKSSRSSQDYEDDRQHRRRKSSKSHRLDEDAVSGADSSLLSSNPTASQRSYRSTTSQGSRMTNNPKLLEMVEDTIKRMILPEINAIKEDQKVERNHRTFDEGRHTSSKYDDYDSSGVHRSVSKSSSTPHLTRKPKVVLNREGDDPGTVLSRGDSEYRKTRKSSRDRPSSRKSSGRHSVGDDDYDDIDRQKRANKSHTLRDAAAGAMVGGILTKAALKHHDSQDDVHERRKRRSKSHGSRSRSASISEATETYSRGEVIPPLPMASHINDSELTRDSILSADTDIAEPTTHDVRTPVREVSRGSVDASMSPASSRTPSRTPTARGLGMSHGNNSIESSQSISTKARMAALGAAGLGGAAAIAASGRGDHHVDADGYGITSPTRGVASPAQSVSSIRKQYEEPLIPGARPGSATSKSSAHRLRETQQSPASLRSLKSSPNTRLPPSRKQSQNVSGDEFITPLERPDPQFMRDGTSTPNGESVEDWYERQHMENERYRDSFDATTNRTSYQTNPYPEDEKRFSTFTQGSQAYSAGDSLSDAQDIRGLGANPQYLHPEGVESAVASLVDPSTLSSNMLSSSLDCGSKGNGTYSDRMAEHHRSMGQDDDAALYEGSTLSQSVPSQNRWAALKGHAADNLSGSTSRENVDVLGSPRQSESRSLHESNFHRDDHVKLGASGLPIADDPMPEIGHFDDTRSEVSTNPSVIKGPLGGDATGKNTWPYTPSPPRSAQAMRETSTSRNANTVKSSHSKEAALLGLAGGAAAIAAAKGVHDTRQASFESGREQGRELTPGTRQRDAAMYQRDGKSTPGSLRSREETYDRQDRVGSAADHYDDEYAGAAEGTPDNGRYADDRNATPNSPAMLRDEGYDTAHDRSAGALTPRQYSKEDVNAYHRAMNGVDGDEDPFLGDPRHKRNVSGNSHGMASPLYDSSTGKGVENIASKDIVALMDHLTVRDMQRNARDTEILVTLVRSGAEMREEFEAMKRFIKEQDERIMQNTDKDADQTVQRVLGGPRPQPATSSPRTPRLGSTEDIQTKRKGVLRRALKGLTGGKSANDLAKIEEMLMQVLDNVEDLKHQGVTPRGGKSMYTTESMDSYEKLRSAPDPGYEPEGAAGTNSTASHSGNLSVRSPRNEKQQFHSGYNGRPGSVNRVSTVLEADEDGDSYLEPHERRVLENQFEHNERLLTPTQDDVRGVRGLSPTHTPPQTAYHGAQHDLTPKSANDKQRKHQSAGSSIFAAPVPKISRWSKTTSSSAAPDPATLDSPNVAKQQRPRSQASQSASSMQSYDDDYNSLRSSRKSVPREHNAETRSIRGQASRLTRTPSPLIPSEASYRDDDPPISPVQEEASTPPFDDPKYQAHRNSLLLQHPQPRQGPTSRHQNALETKAHDFGDSGTNSDLSQRTVSDFDPAQWGSSGAAALSRQRFSEPISPQSLNSPVAGRDGPLIPPLKVQSQAAAAPQQQKSWEQDAEEDEEDDWEPEYSKSGFARNTGSAQRSNMYYSSPLGSGHLLEPIQEVRYSLETDSGHILQISPEPQVARAVDMRGSAQQRRNITGPRPMGSRSPGPGASSGAKLVDTGVTGGTIRRKPVRGSQASVESLESLKSETYLH
nr:hypothetical protein B0A51_05524 [Rachicladosporium sp. CCFEE 5018]